MKTISEIKRLMISPKLIVTILIAHLPLWFEYFYIQRLWQYDLSQGIGLDINSFIHDTVALAWFVPVAGLFPGIPYAFSYLEERSSGFIHPEIIREGRKKYIKRKIILSCLGGAVVMGMAYLIMVLVGIAICEPTTLNNKPQVSEDWIWYGVITKWSGYYVVLLKGLLFILFGILWAEVTLLLSMTIKNKYAAYIMPFLIYHVSWQVHLLFGKLQLFFPSSMIRWDVHGDYSIVRVYVQYALYIVLVTAAILIKFRGDIKRGRI